jgi:hypothetical protein
MAISHHHHHHLPCGWSLQFLSMSWAMDRNRRAEDSQQDLHLHITTQNKTRTRPEFEPLIPAFEPPEAEGRCNTCKTRRTGPLPFNSQYVSSFKHWFVFRKYGINFGNVYCYLVPKCYHIYFPKN